MIRKDGSLFWAIVTLTNLQDATGQHVGFANVTRDITERKRAQEILQTYSRRLIEAQEAERQNIAKEMDEEISHVLMEVRRRLSSIQHETTVSRVHSQVGEAIEKVDEALVHVHDLSLRFHLERRTGSLTKIVERGTKSIDMMLYFLLFNIAPTLMIKPNSMYTWANKASKGRNLRPTVWRKSITMAEKPMNVMPSIATV
jgi:predicted N-formylglutamate amidohydrolase